MDFFNRYCWIKKGLLEDYSCIKMFSGKCLYVYIDNIVGI